MKKITSIVLLIAMVLVLEFNLLEPVFPRLFPWIESGLAFILLAGLILWNRMKNTSGE
ncbi:MAG: hypothetical protein JXR21_01400 [Candidatus Marinimicrobia bacterium]|nr:hypothetical protein [Candidatus Neomarinimicrobiota bacterium]